MLEDTSTAKVRLCIPPVVNYPLMAAWVDHLRPIESFCSDSPPCVFAKEGTHAYVSAWLQLTQILFELIRLPIFDIPRIKSVHWVEGTNDTYHVTFELRWIDSISSSIYGAVIKASLNLAAWFNTHPLSPENRSHVYTIIEDQVILPLKRKVPGGKSTIPVLRVAHSLGIPYAHLGLGVYQIGWGSQSRRLDRSSSSKDSAIGSRLAQNKVTTANLLRLAGLPTPIQYLADSEQQLNEAVETLKYPLVVKPCDQDRGEGVTVDIYDAPALEVAFKKAQAASQSKRVLIEPQAPGVCHRLFIANGKLLYAVSRHPMSVCGDGHRTIETLVNDEFAAQQQLAPWNRSEICLIDDLALAAITRQGYTPMSVPPEGQWVSLRRIESTAWGGVDEDVTHSIHPENLAIALRAAALFDLDMMGVDIISPDITQPWYTNGAIINEVNYVPLLGGAAISRSYLPELFTRFIKGDGRIPIEQAEDKVLALERQETYINAGKRCFVTNGVETWDNLLQPIAMACLDINQRIRALVCRNDVDAIIFYEQ